MEATIEHNGVKYSAEVSDDALVELYRDNVWAGSGRWRGIIDDCAADIPQDVYNALDVILNLKLAGTERDITRHFEGWSDGHTPLGQSAVEGFVAFVWDMREETLYDLQAESTRGQLVDDVLYSVHQAGTTATVYEVAEWIDHRVDDLKAALRESLSRE